MRHALRFLCPYVLGILVLGGCGESGDSDAGGAGGSAGMGGVGGSLGCTKDDDCDDLDVCTADTCNEDGICDYVNADDGTQCLGGEGSCVLGVCRPVEAVFACTEEGIRAAIAAGGGPNGFSCDGPQTVTTEAEININTDVILDGLGNLTVDGNETHTVFSVAVDATAELRRLGVTRGYAPAGSGGGIRNSGTLTLLDSTVTDSSAARFGGGIANLGTMTVAGSRVSENTAGEDGGGVFNSLMLTMRDTTVSGNTASVAGGGVGNTGNSLIMTGCTVSGNQATRNGGGIWNSNILKITNSTLSGNSAVANGGGVRNDSIIEAMVHATLSGNTASTGSAVDNAGVVISLGGSLIDGECSGTAVGSDGHNLESPSNTCGLDQQTDGADVPDLRLAPLKDNGGPTETHALMQDSLARDRIPDAMCDVDEDQRGVLRAQGLGCDVGAFELEP